MVKRVGKWNTVDEKSGKLTSVVEIYEQSGKLFGRIVALTEPNDKQGKPKVCIACTGHTGRYRGPGCFVPSHGKMVALIVDTNINPLQL